jgi:transcriptional regulator with PAS, ATPase and Fis domain
VLDRVIDSDTTVLVNGENGTGKELIAKAIHYNSARNGRRFVVQNCSAFNDNLLDSELFGHRKGAFTGAVVDKQGLFEVADGGTFFLDEIGDMSPALQVKLLRVLQEGTFIPVGDTQSRHVDVRIIAATNRDLARMVERGEFREDLYYRVNVINLTVPPLRERKDDLPVLVDHFLRKHGKNRGKVKKLTRGCLERLVEYAWPGNVRELENEMERLVVLAGDERLVGEELLSPRIRSKAAGPGASNGAAEVAAAGEAGGLPDAIAALERHMIAEVLQRHAGNKTRAASELRISRRNLIRLVQKYRIEGKKR